MYFLEKLCLHSYTCVVMYFLEDDIKWYEHVWEHPCWSSEIHRERMTGVWGRGKSCVSLGRYNFHCSTSVMRLLSFMRERLCGWIGFLRNASLIQTPLTVSKQPDFKKYHHVPKQGSHFSFMDLCFSMAVQQSRLQCNKTTRFLHF